MKNDGRMWSPWHMVIVSTFNALFSMCIDQTEESTKLAEVMSAGDDHCPTAVPVNDQSNEPVVSMGCWAQSFELGPPGC